jgi:hypothetical protein
MRKVLIRNHFVCNEDPSVMPEVAQAEVSPLVLEAGAARLEASPFMRRSLWASRRGRPRLDLHGEL